MPFPAFATFIPLETARLILRPASPADAPAIEPLLSEWEVARHTARVPHPFPEGGAEAWLALASGEREAGRGLMLAIEEKAAGRLTGCIGLETGDNEGRLEIGYWIGRPFWGRGYATEAVRALTGWAFGHLPIREIKAGVFPDNAASMRVLEKAGFRLAGRGVHPAPARGGEREVLLYVLRREA
ncbi:MAG: GNAT family N-acetyltransferase [Candidatus Tectomicrobia bacterium]|uniref:GNAT family N-acetyltransferase n=1 Tax=Tectimicrobiota bacterium TaxID=2528274 RepID=A0A932MM41_UNCTE|nr:GNAT family N-acetyltransferase [Candidatus Tectomicrobia bacterium]